MATRIHTPDGRIIWGRFAPRPRPRLKELNSGFEIMVRFTDNLGTRVEKCVVLEVTEGNEVVVECKVVVWAVPVLRTGKTYTPVPGKLYAEVPILKRIKPGQILAWASDWPWSAKVMSGTPGGKWKCIGLADPAVLDQLALKVDQ